MLLVVAMVLPQQVEARDFSNETLNYEVVYHWGMIWKHAADASLSTRKTKDGYYAQLTGKTRSWADKVYPVRDTLKCTMDKDLKPLRYEKLTHEKDYYARDVIKFSYNYSHTNAHCTRYRKSGTTTLDLSAKTQAYAIEDENTGEGLPDVVGECHASGRRKKAEDGVLGPTFK